MSKVIKTPVILETVTVQQAIIDAVIRLRSGIGRAGAYSHSDVDETVGTLIREYVPDLSWPLPSDLSELIHGYAYDIPWMISESKRAELAARLNAL